MVMRDTRWELKQFQGKAGLEKILADWRRLTQEICPKRVYHFPEWYECYFDGLENDPSAMSFYVLYCGAKPQAIFPLRSAVRRIMGIPLRSLEIPDFLGCFGNPILLPGSFSSETLREFRRGLSKLDHPPWDIVRFPRVLQDSEIDRAWNDLPERWRVRRRKGGCYVLQLQPYEKHFKRLSKNFRGNLKKARNKLARITDAEFVSAHTPEELELAYPDFLTVEASGWKGTEGTGTAIQVQASSDAFFRGVLRRFATLGGCEINLLRADNRTIGGQLLLLVDDSYYLFKVGYDESYARLAPGQMLLEHLLQRHGRTPFIKSINFVSDGAWFADWKPVLVPIHEYILFNGTTRGTFAYGVYAAKKIGTDFSRAWLRRTEPEKRRKGRPTAAK